MNQAEKLFGKSKTDKRVREALKQHPLMTDEQLLKFEKAVLEIAAHERGNRRKAQQLITRVLVPEKMRRGI